jgi:hypothetical protein
VDNIREEDIVPPWLDETAADEPPADSILEKVDN